MTDPTRTTPAETALVDVLLRADPMLDADEAQHLLSALADPVNRDALVAWLVEVGVIEQAVDMLSGAPYWFADGEPAMADAYDPEGLPEHAEPLYTLVTPG